MIYSAFKTRLIPIINLVFHERIFYLKLKINEELWRIYYYEEYIMKNILKNYEDYIEDYKYQKFEIYIISFSIQRKYVPFYVTVLVLHIKIHCLTKLFKSIDFFSFK